MNIDEHIKRWANLCESEENLNDVYNVEEGFRDLTPGLADDLDSSIKILEKYKNYKDWVKNTLDNALNLKELMPRIKII